MNVSIASISQEIKTGGVGVRRTITKDIIEAYGGTIIANSKINKGTEFVIRVPKKVE